MPVYEYKCNKCGKHFEYEQKITEAPLTKCPYEICEEEEKGQGTVERIISKNIGFVFNGSGFYLTDYVHKHSQMPDLSKKYGNSSSDKINQATAPPSIEKK
mgnify:CR=1 FL=1